MSDRSKPMVRAAGGVVRRPAGDHVEVLVVHRPRHRDWTLPKGKALEGETDEECALREVAEETGLICEIEREVGVTSYRDADGRTKTVRYFAMRPLSGSFTSGEEVDEIRWLRGEEAASRLSYEGDRRLVASL
jgi:8-oxo-dGTP pyrophosphatase MutT (NUDIX family)